jgi:hypothetical protein
MDLKDVSTAALVKEIAGRGEANVFKRTEDEVYEIVIDGVPIREKGPAVILQVFDVKFEDFER